MIIIRDGTRLYFIDKKLIMLKGRTKMGKIGMFVDEERGLCSHEEVRDYCSFCREYESE